MNCSPAGTLINRFDFIFMLESTFVYNTLLFMKKGFSVGVSILLFRCLNKRKYEYVYLIEMWVNFLCISNRWKSVKRERGRNTNKKKRNEEETHSLLLDVSLFVWHYFWPYFLCVCLAVNRILGGLNATWQEQSVAYFKAPQEMDTNKKSLFSGQLFFLHIQQPKIHENITYICFV